MHRVWLGGALPREHRDWAASFDRHHPRWTSRLWTDADLGLLGIGDDDLARCRTPSEAANVARYEILHRFGGVYLDTDVECRGSLDPVLRGVRAFAALELPGRLGNAILGAMPGHPVFARAVREVRPAIGTGVHSAEGTGPGFLTRIAEREPGLTIFGPQRFYPYLWTEPHRRDEPFPDALLVHHWQMSWCAAQGVAGEGVG